MNTTSSRVIYFSSDGGKSVRPVTSCQSDVLLRTLLTRSCAHKVENTLVCSQLARRHVTEDDVVVLLRQLVCNDGLASAQQVALDDQIEGLPRLLTLQQHIAPC